MKFTIALGALLLAAASAAQAHIEVFKGTLLGSKENPQNASPGTGLATVTFDLDLVTMRVEASFKDLIGNTTASHIHCCTNPPGNIGVASQTPSFTLFPLGVKAGSYDHLFDMTLASSYNASFITANGGTVSGAFNALVLGMEAGRAYLNIHSSAFPGGEIRSFLVLSPIPEPASYAMMLLGLAGLGVAAARRGRA